MNTDNSITVVMATYNGERFIREQLDSIEAQELKPNEVIISDDSSTDQTISIVKAFMKESSLNIRLIENPIRLGYSQNFMVAARTARSSLISFCDQDDVWFPEKLRVCAEALDQYGADLCVHTARVIDHDGRHIGEYKNLISSTSVYGPQSHPLALWRTYAGFTMVFRRELLNVLPADERGISYIDSTKALAHDGWLYFVSSNLRTIVTLDRNLAFYRQHQNNHSGSLPVGILQKISRSVGDAYHPNRRLADVSEHWSNILKTYGENSSGDERTIALQAAKFWNKIYRLEADRVLAYTNSRRSVRLGKFLKINFRGYYALPSRRKPVVGLMLKDFLVGVLRLRKQKG